MRRTLALIVIVAGLALPGHALAQNKAGADAAFKEGKRLLDAGETAAACAKFEGSLKLMEQLGVRLNLADCYERLGKLSAAYASFRAAELAAKQSRDPRGDFAAKRRAALEERMPYLTIKLAAGASLPGLEIKRDGEVIDRGLLDTALPVDPGEHTVEVTAPGHKRWSTWVESLEKSRKTIEVPKLEVDPTAKPDQKPDGDDDDKLVPDRPDPEQGEAPEGNPGRTRRMIGIGVGAGGLAALGTGLFFGMRASSKWSDAKADGHCNDDGQCDDIGYPIAQDARRAATVSTILVGVGVVAVGAGVVLYLTAPSGGDRGASARLTPVLGPDGAGVAVLGDF